MISGASGGFLVSYPLNLTPGEVITITIGAGGPVRPADGAGQGAGGGTTTFGSYLSCTGGGSSGTQLSFADVGNCGASGGVGLFGQYINTDTNNASGYVVGGQPPTQFGSGGGAGRCSGCVAPNYSYGYPGAPGVVVVDVLY